MSAHDVRCPACESAECSASQRIARHLAIFCGACSHAFLRQDPVLLDALASLYEAGYQGHRRDPVFAANIRREIEGVLGPRLPAGGRILDVGCGNGEFLAAAAEFGYEPTGIDLSESAAETCRLRGLDAVAGDFLAHDFGAARFDLITFWDVLEHLPRPLEYARRAAALLAPSGRLLAKSPLVTRRAIALASAVPRLAGPLLHVPKHVQFFVPESMRAMLALSGLDEIEWPPARPLRGRRPGAGARRALKRLPLMLANRACGNGNVYVLAHRRGGSRE